MSIRAPRLLLTLLLLSGTALAQVPDAAPIPPGGAAATAPPAAEDAAIRRLRDLLGPDIRADYRAAQVLDSAAGRVRFDGLRLHGDGIEISAEALTIDGLRDDGVQELEIRDLRLAADNGMRLSAQHVQLSGFSIQQPATAIGLFTSSRIDRFAMEGAEAGLDGTQVTLGRLAIEDYGPGRQSGVRAEDLAMRWVNDGPDAFSLARFAVSGLDIATQVAAFVTNDPSRIGASRSTLLAEAFTLFEGGRAIIEAERLQGDSDSDATLAGSSRLTLRGLRLDGLSELREVLAELGYTSLVGEITMESRFEPRHQRLSIPGLSIAAPGFGRLAFGAELGGFDMQAAQPDAALAGLRLLGLTLGYRDDGLLPRLFRWQAAEQGLTEQELRAEIVDMVRTALDGQAAGPLRKAIERFLRGEARALEIAARPPQPLPLRELGDGPWPDNAEALLRRYGLTATAR